MSAQEPTPTTVAELFTRIARGRADLEEWTATLNAEQLSQPRKDGWAIKDHLIHMAMWEKGMAALLRQEPRFAAMGIDVNEVKPNDSNAINRQVYLAHQSLAAQEALALFHATHMELLGELAKLSDVDLQKPYSYFQPSATNASASHPIIGWIIGNTYEHYEEHVGWIRAMLAS